MRVDVASAEILDRACYGCHSNRTRWPWYSRLAPISWLVARDVNNGRRHLNFSTWDRYSDDPETVVRKLENISKELGDGRMPPWYYVVAHPAAKLSNADRETLLRWVIGAIGAEQKSAPN